MNQRVFTILEVIVIGALVLFVMYIGGAFKGPEPAPTATRAQPSPAPTLTAANPASDSSWFVAGGTVYEVAPTQPGPRSSTLAVTPTFPPLTKPTGLIAFDSTRDGNSEIYVVDVESGVQTNLTNNPAEDYAPFWSPDGKRIAFLSTRSGWLELYVMNVDGAGAAQVSHTFGRNIAYQAPFLWSSDGKWILAAGYRVWPGNHGQSFAALDLLESTGAKTITLYEQQSQYSFWMPSWSPDGKYITLNVLSEQDGCLIYIGQLVNQRLDLQPTDENCSLVSWLADSSRLLFSNGSAIFTIKPDGSDKRRLGEYSPNTNSLFLSPQGQLLVSTSPAVNNGQSVHVIRVDGTGRLDLSKEVVVNYDSPISWSPDEQWIVYHTSSVEKNFSYDRADVFVVNIYDSSNPVRLTDTGNNFSPQWQP